MCADELDKSIKRLDMKLDRLKEKDKSVEDLETYEGVLDRATLKTLYNFVNRKIITNFYGVVSAGKEANIYWAKNNQVNYAVKIYRTATLDFKKMQIYIIGDPRFKKIRHNTKSLVYAWALKEFKNLKRAHSIGLRVPEPITIKNNILIMQFIGDEGKPAPLLKNVILDKPKKVYSEIVEFMEKLYKNSKLVHADLSEFNILYYNGPVVIDMSQSLLTSHPMAIEFLKRDIKNVIHFFKSLKVETHNEEELFDIITKS